MEELKFRRLRADEIEVRVKQVTEWGASCVLYKTARTDMDILDESVSPLGWSCEYQEIKGNLYCGITINGVSKWDCGIESRDDGDGTKKKGEASDAFKRAGFKWGIGRELYTAPRIIIDLPRKPDGDRDKSRWKLERSSTTLSVSRVEYDDNGNISCLHIIEDRTRKVVYAFPKGSAEIEPIVIERVNVPAAETAKQKDLIFTIARNRGFDEKTMRMKCESWYSSKHNDMKPFDSFTHEDIVELKVNLTKVFEHAM